MTFDDISEIHDAFSSRRYKDENNSLKVQLAECKKDADTAQNVVSFYEMLCSPFYKLIPIDKQIKLRDLGYELKYLPIYADQPDPTYIVNWVWEVRDSQGSAVTQAHKWMYSAIDEAMVQKESTSCH